MEAIIIPKLKYLKRRVGNLSLFGIFAKIFDVEIRKSRNMKGLIHSSVRVATILVAAAALFMSCSKDEVFGRINLESPILVVDRLGGTATMHFTSTNVRSLSVTSVPAGWKAEADLTAGTVVVTAPLEINDDQDKSGSVVMSGTSTSGSSVSSSFNVGLYEAIDLSDKPSNSYLISTKDAYYYIDGTHKGETSETLPAASAKLIWQTSGRPVQYVDWKDGKIAFFVGVDDDDELKEGNALIGAYDASGTLLWSWHIWVADYDSETDVLTYSNGVTAMNRNLGALNNANSTQEEILDSYGMYYQWGRKEPFVGPSTYNAAKSINAAMYNSSGKRVYMTEVESAAGTGTAQYALQNPLSFIKGVKDSKYDWLFTSHDATRWADTKTINDPCPRGWKVPASDAFAVLAIADKSGQVNELAEAYGWTLTDGDVTSLYMGLGRRTYLTGKIQNTYNPPLPEQRNTAIDAQPWEGLYWTTGTEAEQSSAFYFYFNKKNVQASGIESGVPHYRANGMQIRCVKAE